MTVFPNHVDSISVFFNNSEIHYATSTHINTYEYPQVHDFYEIVLIIENKLDILINHQHLTLERGQLLLIRPHDVHTKIQNGPSKHINLAFPAYTVQALFRYLYDSEDKLLTLSGGTHLPITRLSSIDTILMENRLSYLNRFSVSAIEQKNTYLRRVLTDIFFSYIMPEVEKQQNSSQLTAIPSWLAQAVEGLSDPKNLELGMDYLIRQTNRSPEHICRTFRKYLNMTPSTYINAKRLNYATNLLTHTDMEIADVIYESGFQSVNYFYHLFKKEYHMSPLKYKNQYHMIQKL